MKYNLLLLTSIIISSIISGMEITYTSSSLSKWRYHKKTTITIANQRNNNNDISIQLDHNGTLNMNNKIKGLHKSSPRKNKIECFERV
jgi:hypothetical protein